MQYAAAAAKLKTTPSFANAPSATSHRAWDACCSTSATGANSTAARNATDTTQAPAKTGKCESSTKDAYKSVALLKAKLPTCPNSSCPKCKSKDAVNIAKLPSFARLANNGPKQYAEKTIESKEALKVAKQQPNANYQSKS